MQDELKRRIVDLLDRHEMMTGATIRPDGWPPPPVTGTTA
jgi:hypothetical protein